MKLVITSGKGGVGKSMLTSALAILFAKNEKVTAVDCDADAPNLGIWLGGIKKWDKVIKVFASTKPKINYKECDGCGLCTKKCNFSAIKMVKGKPKVNSFLCEGCGVCEEICPKKAIKLRPVQNGEIKIKKTEYGFPLVSGQLFPGETGSGKIVSEIKKEADKFDCDIQIIDSAPGTGCPVTAALRDANLVILVTEPTLSGLTDLTRVLEVVNYFKIPFWVIINKWDINPQITKKIVRIFKGKVLGKISYDKKIFKAISNLTPIMKTDLKAKKEIKEIFKKLAL
jgi:MinD superfamily P-loop ATPase